MIVSIASTSQNTAAVESRLERSPLALDIDRLFLQALSDKHHTYAISWFETSACSRFKVTVSCGHGDSVDWHMRISTGNLDRSLWTMSCSNVSFAIQRIRQSYNYELVTAKHAQRGSAAKR